MRKYCERVKIKKTPISDLENYEGKNEVKKFEVERAEPDLS